MMSSVLGGISNWLRSLEEEKRRKKRNGMMTSVLAVGAAAGLAALTRWGLSNSFGSGPVETNKKAEEAQRLRRLQKRRKAESMRLLDMERRQKERVEEMRSTQKKDEKNMNLREVVRAEIRKELSILETTCHNMASLLHSFGIHVDKEVQTAYKRALLNFHPDRASQSGIHQQVEAEEKFKLMNRMKEKFSPPL